MKSRINILSSLVNGEEVDCEDNQDIEEFYNQVMVENGNIQFIHEGENSFLAIFVDILNHHTGGEAYTIDRLIEIIRSEIGENFVVSRQQLYIHAEILARRFNLPLIFQDLEGEIIMIGEVDRARPSNQINLFQIDDGFVYLGRNEPLVVIENIPIIDIPNGTYFGDENETVLICDINPLYREILEGADYRLFRNPGHIGLEAEICNNIMQEFASPAEDSPIDAQTDTQQWHPEWQIIVHNPGLTPDAIADYLSNNYPDSPEESQGVATAANSNFGEGVVSNGQDIIISHQVQRILEIYGYQLFHNPEPQGLEAEIYHNVGQGFSPSAEAVTINGQTYFKQLSPEWHIVKYDPNMYNVDHFLAVHNHQNDPQIPAGFQGTILPSIEGMFGNINTNEILAFFMLVGIAFYLGNGYNGAGDCG